MIWLLLSAIVSFIIMIAAKIHGFAGAVILGLDFVGTDIFLQWLRVRILKKAKFGQLVWGIFGGLLVRIISIIAFLKFGSVWLGGLQSVHFFVFVLFLITLPIWSLIGVRKFKLEKD